MHTYGALLRDTASRPKVNICHHRGFVNAWPFINKCRVTRQACFLKRVLLSWRRPKCVFGRPDVGNLTIAPQEDDE